MADAPTGAGPAVNPSPAASGKPGLPTSTTSAMPANPSPGSTQVGNQTPSSLWLAMKQAMTTAQKTKKKAPVDAATNSYVTLDANPDGSFTANQSLLPQRTQQNGAWVPIDTTLGVGADKQIHPKAGLENITLSGGGNAPLAVEDDKFGHILTLSWPNSLPAPAISGDTATYQDVYPGVDLQMTVTSTGLRDQLVVHSAAAADNPALKTINIGYTGSGLSITSTPSGGLSAVDASGKEIFGGPTPQMWDSATTTTAKKNSNSNSTTAPTADVPASTRLPHQATIPVTVSAGKISVTPDAKVLSGPDTVYPVKIDPTVSENAQNWIEIWSNISAPSLDPYDGSPWPYSPYDTSSIRVGNTSGTLVRSLMSFNTSFLPRPGSPTDGPPPIYIVQANLNLTAQSSVCPSTQMWRANPFTPNANWANQDSPELWPASGSDFTNPLATVGGSTSCAGHGFSINDTTQVRDVYAAGGSTFTVGLRAANESSTTNNYGSFYVQNNAGAANLSVTFVAEPSLGTLSVGNSWIGNDGQQVNACTSGYLPMQSSTIPVSAPLYELDSNRWLTYSIYVSGASGEVAPYYTSGATTQATGTLGTSASTVANGQSIGSVSLVDGQSYTVWMDALDGHWELDGLPGPNADQYTVPLHDAWNNGGNNYPAPYSTKCSFQAAFSPPAQPTIASTTFPAAGQHIATGYPTVGTAGTVYVNDTAPHTPIDHFDWALNTTTANEGSGHCGSPSPAGIACGTTGAGSYNALSVTNAPITIPASGEHWGDNYLYVSAVDKAGNVSPYGRYDFFLAQSWQPVSFGDVTGDGVPDVMGVDAGGNLVTYQSNTDITPGAASGTGTTPNTVQAAPAASAPNGTSWASAKYTHRGSERVEPTDDLFAWDTGTDGNGHLYYYFNADLLSNTTSPGLNPVPANDAFTQTRQAVVTRPTCTPTAASGWCIGYANNWNNIKQILALGPAAGGCTITAPTTACKTNLITVESDPSGGPTRMWMFSPAGVGQLRNPILLSTSTANWEWSQVRLMTPGNAAAHSGGPGGLQDLWAEDTSGTLWQFANTGAPTSLGNLSGKTVVGAAGQFSAYKWIHPSVDGSGNPDIWAMWNDGQISVLTGTLSATSAAPLSANQQSATGLGWANTANPTTLQGQTLPAGIAGQLISDVSYYNNAGRQVCMDDLNGSTANSTTVIDAYDCNGTWPQRWTFAADGSIHLMGSNPATPPNKCLDTGGLNVIGSKVTIYDCQAGNYNQIWKIVPSVNDPGTASLLNPASGLCLDDTGYGTNNTNPFQLWQCSDNSAQRFTLPSGLGQTQSAEAESLWGSNSGGTMTKQTSCCGASWSPTNNSSVIAAQEMLVNSAAGSTMTLNYYLANPGTYLLAPVMTSATDYGKVTASIDNASLPNTFDGYQASGVSTKAFPFGKAVLSAGMHSFTFKAASTNPASTGNRYNLGVDALFLIPVRTTGPIAAVNISNPNIVNAPVTADASTSIGGTATINSYNFDFGDGYTTGATTTPSATHSYTKTGAFTVTVTVNDASGAVSTASQEVVITGPVANPGFETGSLAGWPNSYSATTTTTNTHSGTYAGQITVPTGQATGAAVEQIISGLSPNTSYNLSGWVLTDGGTTILGAKNYDAAGTDTGNRTTSIAWIQINTPFTTGPNNTSVDVYCYRSTVGTSTCDDIQLEQTPTTPSGTVLNGGFESGDMAGWSSSYKTGVTTVNPHSGTYAAEINIPTGQTGGAADQVINGLTPNTSYTLTGWVRTDGGSTILGAKNYTSAGTSTDSTTTSTGWTQLTDHFTTGATNTSVEIYCYRSAAGVSDCDDVTLTSP